MAKAGLTLANPRLSGMNTQTSLVGDYTLSVPRYAPPADTSVAEAGGQMLKTASLMGQMSEPTYGSSVKIDPTQNKVSVGGVAFDMDDYAQAVGTESLIGQPTVDATEGNWIDLDEGSWRQYVEGIKNPSTAERAKRNWEVGVANYLGTLGGLAQLVGAEEYGANLVLEQERVKQKLAPFVQEFTKVTNPEEAGAAIVGTLAQQGPNAIDAILFGAAGALLGTATGGPAAALGGAAASLAGRQALKKAMVTAAEKYVAKQPLNKLDKAALRAAKQMSDVAGLSAGRATAPTADAVLKLAKRQAAMGGALAGAAVGSYKSALGEVYGEFRQQGAGPEDMGARLGAAAAAVPFGALDFAGDVVIGGLGTSLLKGGAKTAYKELSLLGKGKEALRRGAKGAAIATPVGGATEAGQEAILIGATGQDFSDPKNLTRLLESFIAGGVGEGTVGGIANIVGPVDAMKREALPNPNATPVGTAAEPEAPTAPPAAPVPPTGGPMSYGALPPQESVPPAPPTPTAEVEPPAPVGPTVTMQSDTNVKGSKGNTRTITMSTGATYTIKRDKTGWRLVAEDGTETDLGTKAKPEAITKIIELETERQRSLPPKPAPLSTVVSDEPVVGAALTRRKITMSNGITVTIEKARGGWNVLDEDGNPGEFLGTKKEDALAALEQLAVGGIAPGTVNPRLAPLQQELARIDASIYAINSQLTAIDTGRVTATPEERQALETQKAQAFRMRDYVQQGITTADVGVMRPDFPSAEQLFDEAAQVVLNGTVKPDAKSIADALLIDEKVAADLIKQMVDKKILVGPKGKYKINENIPEEMRMEIGQGRETTALGQQDEQSLKLSTAVASENLADILDVLDTNENPTIRDVAKRARYLIGKVRIKMVSDGSIGARVLGRYFYGGARIGDLELTPAGSMSPWVVSHELVHALTSTYIDQRPNSAAVKRMDALYKYVKSLAAFDAYGFKNIQEFVAEGLTNSEFQTKLMQVRYRGPSLWSRFARAVADILGIKYNTAFTELLTIYGDMATQQELEIDTLLAANRGRSRGIGVAKLKKGVGAKVQSEAVSGARTIDVDGVQRSTTNSSGQPIHPTQEGIRNFWRWFGDSKAVDEQGRPLVVYHATGADISKFDLGAGRKSGAYHGAGFYFADAGLASEYLPPAEYPQTGYEEGANVVPVYLQLNNPFYGDLTADDVRALLEWPKFTSALKKIREEFGDPNIIPSIEMLGVTAGDRNNFIREALVRAGYDGRIITFNKDAPQQDPETEYVAFYPEQIKSAVGNAGTFTPKSGNIAEARVTRDELQRLKKGAQQKGVGKYPEGRRRLAKNRQDRNVAAQDQGAGGEAGDTGGVQQGGRVQVPKQDKIGLATGVPPSEFVPRFAPSKVEQLISKLPLPLQDPLLAITDSFGNLGPRLVAKLGMGNQLLDAAVRYNIPSARKYARLTRERGAIVERKQEAYVRWAEAHNKLPAQYRGTGEGTVNGLIQRMTQEDKWAFTPNYFRGEDKDASIVLDQELAAEFNAMPREAQAVVIEAFRLNYDTLKDMQQSVMDMTVSEYDVLIANATSEKDRVAYEKAKEDSLKQYERLLRIDPTTPYAPLSRYGKWVVIGKSDAFIAAQEADNRTEIERLQSDPNHYFVDYADTRAEAARMQREIINTYGGNPRNAQIAQRSDAEESMYGGRDMMYAFQRLNSMIERESMSPEIAKQLRKRVVEMQLMAMANTSARKAELRRKNIASGDLDMVQIILSRGRATAHFIGSVHKNKEIVDAIGDMRKEVKVNDGKREERQAIYNGILARYVDGMTAVPENSLSDNMTSLTSFWMLGLAPSYYLQQAMQNMMITLPFIASRHGYDETFAAMRAGYKQVMKAWSDGGVLDQLDINKVDPKYRALANYLAESGELDVGINKEMGTLTADSGGAISNTMKRVTDSVRALTRKIEAINRLSAGIAMYELELAADRKGKTLERSYDTGAYQSYLNDFAKAHPLDTPLTETQFAAANNALRVVTDTHGNYGYENTPVFLRGPWGRVLGQFQKFRIILAGLYIREINNWLRSTSPEDRAVARRAVLYMSGHAAIAGGLLGSPVAAVFALVYNVFAGSEDEREDMEKDIRQAIGDPTIANLLLKGLPTLAGVDMSGTLGQGTILSVAPYTDLPTDRDSYAKYILSLTGPAIGGIGGNLYDAVSLAGDGNYYKAMEKVMPRGVGGAMRSLREALGGETNTANELLVSPVELSAVESFWGTIGFQPIDRANRQFARNQFYKDQKFYQDRVSDVKRAYVEAFRAKDTEKMQQLRGEWKQLQQVREQRGLKPQPLMQLLNAPREVARQEQRTVGGLQFGPSTERQARELAGLAGG